MASSKSRFDHKLTKSIISTVASNFDNEVDKNGQKCNPQGWMDRADKTRSKYEDTGNYCVLIVDPNSIECSDRCTVSETDAIKKSFLAPVDLPFGTEPFSDLASTCREYSGEYYLVEQPDVTFDLTRMVKMKVGDGSASMPESLYCGYLIGYLYDKVKKLMSQSGEVKWRTKSKDLKKCSCRVTLALFYFLSEEEMLDDENGVVAYVDYNTCVFRFDDQGNMSSSGIACGYDEKVADKSIEAEKIIDVFEPDCMEESPEFDDCMSL